MKTLKIEKSVRLPGTDIILEKGDRVQIRESNDISDEQKECIQYLKKLKSVKDFEYKISSKKLVGKATFIQNMSFFEIEELSTDNPTEFKSLCREYNCSNSKDLYTMMFSEFRKKLQSALSQIEDFGNMFPHFSFEYIIEDKLWNLTFEISELNTNNTVEQTVERAYIELVKKSKFIVEHSFNLTPELASKAKRAYLAKGLKSQETMEIASLMRSGNLAHIKNISDDLLNRTKKEILDWYDNER